MNQIVKDKMQREIMVVNAGTIFKDFPRETRFYDASEYNFWKVMVDNYEFMVRADAEVNTDFKQPLPYWVVIDQENRIFVYQRGWSWSNAWETRLHSKISIWVGWHIEREDEDAKNILSDTLVREIIEEINTKEENIKNIHLAWYINDDWNDVWKVHMWIFYIVRVANSDFELLDWELDNWEFVTLSTLEWMIMSGNYDLESWSQIIIPSLKKYLNK